jgi:hypothetical protein
VRVAGLVFLGVFAGCNSLFGLEATELRPELDASLRPDGDPHADLDRDGIKDVVDSCIAPAADGLIDSDGDGVPNGKDICAFDTDVAGDSDGDGFGDVCDPYPSLVGDRLRCLMTFSDPDMDIVMWKARDTVAMPWVLYEPRALQGFEGSIVADWPFESSAVTTYEIRGRFIMPTTGDFAVLPRAGLIPLPTDVGCKLSISGAAWTLDTVPSSGAPVPVPVITALSVQFRMLVTMAPKATGNNLGCSLTIGSAPSTVATRVTLPEANLGFSTSARVTIQGIVIYERDDAPPL